MSIKAGTSGASLAHYMMNMLEESNNQHTGFTLYPVSGTMTGGTVTVYGYRKA
jgi:glycerol uptake facilitator-like aquaporin